MKYKAGDFIIAHWPFKQNWSLLEIIEAPWKASSEYYQVNNICCAKSAPTGINWLKIDDLDYAEDSVIQITKEQVKLVKVLFA